MLLATYGSRGDVEPLVGLATALRGLGADVRICAPPDEEFADLLTGAGMPLVPLGAPMRSMARPSSSADSSRRVAELIATQFDTLVAAAEGCDVLLATGFTHFAARSVTDRLGIRYVYATFCPTNLPSPHHPPSALPGRPFPPGVTDNRVLWDLDAQSRNALWGSVIDAHRASVGLPPVADVTEHMLTGRPWLACDPALGPWHEPAELDVVRTGAWVLPGTRPLPAELTAFLEAGTPPVYVGFGSMRPSADAARVAIEAIRAQGRRALVSHGWAGLGLIDDRDDCLTVGEANHQELFGRVAAVVHHGGAGTTVTAARAGVPQVVVPQAGDQPYWAARVAELGIGAAHDGPLPTTASLSAALRAALTPETRVRARTVAATIRTDGATTAARLLADTTSRQRPPVSA